MVAAFAAFFYGGYYASAETRQSLFIENPPVGASSVSFTTPVPLSNTGEGGASDAADHVKKNTLTTGNEFVSFFDKVVIALKTFIVTGSGALKGSTETQREKVRFSPPVITGGNLNSGSGDATAGVGNFINTATAATGYGYFNGENLSADLRVGGIYGDLGLYAKTYNMQFDLADNKKFEFTIRGQPSVEIEGNGGHIRAEGDVTASNLITKNGGFIQIGDDARLADVGKAGGFKVIGLSGPIGVVYAGAYYYDSDKSLKNNIQPLANPLGKVQQLQGVSFNWKGDSTPGIGFIAQDVEKVFPELVSGEEGEKSVAYGNLVAVLVEAIKAQQKEIDILKTKVGALENK